MPIAAGGRGHVLRLWSVCRHWQACRESVPFLLNNLACRFSIFPGVYSRNNLSPVLCSFNCTEFILSSISAKRTCFPLKRHNFLGMNWSELRFSIWQFLRSDFRYLVGESGVLPSSSRQGSAVHLWTTPLLQTAVAGDPTCLCWITGVIVGMERWPGLKVT